MTRVGTGFVDIQPDLSGFGKGLDAKITTILRGVSASVGKDLTRAVSKSVGAADTKVKVDVDRRSLAQTTALIASAAKDAFQTIKSAAGGIGGAIGGALSGLQALGPVLRGAAIVLGTLMLPAAVALGASLVTAAAGAAALGVALAGAFGPVALVGVAIVTRLALIVKAVADAQNAASDAGKVNAQATAAVSAATQGLAGAQENLKQQTVAAWQAYHDAIEQVKDDLLGVKDAQLGVESANLATKEAQNALKQFRREAGAAGQSLDAVFKKFTDVHVDPSGLRAALTAARRAAGDAPLDTDQELRLERLILNIRQAKQQEKHAADELHDSNVRLGRDRRVEADFLRQGIKAYPPYRDAVKGLASAQQQLTDATSKQAEAFGAQRKAFDGLSKSERRFGALVLSTGKALKGAFSPAVSRALGGISTAIGATVRLLRDPKVAKSLNAIGDAIGDVFRDLAKEIGRKEIRDSFVTLAKGGARLVRVFGSKVFISLERIFVRIATAALPHLLDLMDRLGVSLGGVAKGTEDSKKLDKSVGSVVKTFERWLELTHQVGRVILGVLKAAAPEGDSLVGSLTKVTKKFADFLNTDEGRKKVRQFFHDAVELAKKIARGLGDVIEATVKIVNWLKDHKRLIELAAGAWAAYKTAAILAITKTKIEAFRKIFEGAGLGPAKTAGQLAGARYMRWFRVGALAGVVAVGTGIAIKLNDAFTTALDGLFGDAKKARSGRERGFDSLRPAPIELAKKIASVFGVHLATGGVVPGTGVGDTVPAMLTPGEFVMSKPAVNALGIRLLRDLNSGGRNASVTARHTPPRFARGGLVPAFAGQDGGGSTFIDKVILPPAPAAAVPDARYQAVQFANEIARRR